MEANGKNLRRNGVLLSLRHIAVRRPYHKPEND
jgi:hypothetical protein